MSSERVILLVEDDPADRLMVERALEGSREAVRLEIAGDGVEALEYLGLGPSGEAPRGPLPDLVLADLNMPRVDGRELLQALRAVVRFENVPIVLLTTSSAEQDIADCYAHGASGYVVKPADLDELSRILTSVQEYWFRVVALPTRV